MASVVGSGRCVVAAAGTARQLGGTGTTMTPAALPSGPVNKLIIAALETNTNAVAVGGSGVVGLAASRQGVRLLATGPPLVLEDIDDLGDIFVDAITSGEGVCFTYTVK